MCKRAPKSLQTFQGNIAGRSRASCPPSCQQLTCAPGGSVYIIGRTVFKKALRLRTAFQNITAKPRSSKRRRTLVYVRRGEAIEDGHQGGASSEIEDELKNKG